MITQCNIFRAVDWLLRTATATPGVAAGFVLRET